jgi:BirA family biotin operon repressor/biotin-[acetyl-CoA-carboxylase] ligase
LQFLAAVATRQALEEETGLDVKLKWPNDLVLGNSKLGGILTESKTQGDRVSFAILGIGLNINQVKDQIPKGAISVRLASGKKHDLRAILRAILDQIKSWYTGWDNPSRIMEQWWRNCAHQRLRVQVTLSRKDTLTGVSRGIDDDGSLLIETDDHRIQRVSDGSLTLLED